MLPIFQMKKKPYPYLLRLYRELCIKVPFPKFIPQFLALKYEQERHPPMEAVIIDCSENIPSLVIPVSNNTVITWPNFESLQNGIRDSLVQISEALQRHRHLKVKNLVLNNFVCSFELIRYLFKTFNELKKLKFTSFNTDCNIDVFLPQNALLDELEMTLPSSKGFFLGTSAQMTKFSITTLQPNTETGTGKPQIIKIDSPLLEVLRIFKHPLDLSLLFLTLPPTLRLKYLIFNANGKNVSFNTTVNWYSGLIIIHVGRYDEFKFLIKSQDRRRISLDFTMVPECVQLGLFDEDGNLHIIWEKQIVATPIVMTLTQ